MARRASGSSHSTCRKTTSTTQPTPYASEPGGAFAYQAIAGVAYPLGALPRVKFTAEYRYFGTARTDVPVTRTAIGGNTVNGAIPTAYTRNGFLGSQNMLMLGLRYNSGAR